MGESQKIMQVRSARQVPVRVQLLDDDIFNHSVDKRAVGWILFDKVCEHVNIIEKDYFGLNYYVNGEKFWVNNDKKIAKQLKGQNWDFNFEVKFYPADPTQLAEDISRYQLCLQIRRDIVNERLPCSFVTYTLLGSYTAQSELGDYDTEEFGSGYKYLKDIQFAPHQDKELLMKIAELHRQHKGETPEEAEVHFLENATKLAMYGVELHAAKDAEGRDIQLGVCASGLIVYKDKQQINRFVWPKVLKISYRRNKYYIKIRPGEFETFASLIGFKLANVKYAKRLWKISVEHHSFFRFREPEHQKSVSFLPRFGSRFRYSGRTQFQTRQVVAEENRESPFFDRVLSKRGTFGGRTTNMRKRDEERQQRRDEMRRAPFPPQTKIPPHEQKKEHPPEPTRTPPEPKHAPPIAPKPGKPKPSPRGPSSVDDNASLDRELTGSLNDSFDDVPDRKSRMEKIHAVATPLAALMQSKKEHEQHEEEHHREEAHKHRDEPNSDDDHRDDHHRANRHRDDHHDDDHDRSYDQEEHDSRPMTPEVIAQDYTVLPAQRPQSAMSDKEKKAFAKQEKERVKREKEQEKLRKKEEEKERKRLEKEKKALLAEEKKAAKQKSKQKGKDKKDVEKDVRERRDSRGSNDMGRDWDQVRSQDERGPVTPERSRKRLSSFEDIKHNSFKAREADGEEDRPPTPPAPLPVGARGDNHSGSDYDSEDDDHKGPGRRESDEEDAEEVSF